MKNHEEGMEKILSIEKTLTGMMEMHKLVLELKGLESRHQEMIKTLEASEKRYKTFLESIPLRFCIKGRDLHYIYCNEQYAQDLKIGSEEIAGKTDRDFFPGDVAERYRLDDQRILETGTTEETEEGYAPGGCQELMVHKITSPIRDERGGAIGILNVFWDVTEQKRNEEELRKYRAHLEELLSDRTSELQRTQERLQRQCDRLDQTEAQLRKLDQKGQILFEHTGLALAVMGAEDMMISETNREFKMLFGISGEADSPKYLSELICQEDLEKMKQDYPAGGGGGDPRPGRKEYDFIDREGKKKHLAVTLAMIPETQKVVASFWDFTQRRQMEKELRKSEERHRSLFEDAPVAIGVIQEGVFKFLNPNGLNLLGRSREDLSSRPAQDLTHPDSREEFQNQLNRVQTGGGPLIYSWRIAQIDGTGKWLENRMVKIQWEGEPAVLNIMTDITAFKEAFEELYDAVRPFRPVVDTTEKISRLVKGGDQE